MAFFVTNHISTDVYKWEVHKLCNKDIQFNFKLEKKSLKHTNQLILSVKVILKTLWIHELMVKYRALSYDNIAGYLTEAPLLVSQCAAKGRSRFISFSSADVL